MNLSTRTGEYGIRHNTRCKAYPDGTGEALTASKSVFREAGWEVSDKWDRRHSEDPLLPPDPETEYAALERAAKLGEDGRAAAQAAAASRERAQRRARTQVRDLALCNSFDYFVTLTLDAQRVDRHDVRAVTRKLNQWLDNAVRRHGLKYVLVPELHKDGAIHFHGFFNGALRAVDSGTVIPPEGGKPRRPRSARQRSEWLEAGGHVVFNLPQWTMGFTTAIELYGDYRAAVGYVCKYISKEQQKIGGRWFYHGGELRTPDVWYEDRNIDDMVAAGAETFGSETLPGVTFAVLRVGEGGEIDGKHQQRAEGARRAAHAGTGSKAAAQYGGAALHGGGAAEQRRLAP